MNLMVLILKKRLKLCYNLVIKSRKAKRLFPADWGNFP